MRIVNEELEINPDKIGVFFTCAKEERATVIPKKVNKQGQLIVALYCKDKFIYRRLYLLRK